MLEEEYEKGRRALPRHLRRRAEPERAFSYRIRPLEDRDLPDIREIYNHYVTNSVVTFDEETWSIAKWRKKRDQLRKLGLPFLVAESPTGQVLGYALVQPMSSKSAYRYSVENSIYLGQAATGKGLGRALLEALIEACERAGIRQMVAVISDKGAEGSVALHEKLGFVEVGRMGRVGYKFGRWLGTIYLQKALRPAKKAPGSKGDAATGAATGAAATGAATGAAATGAAATGEAKGAAATGAAKEPRRKRRLFGR